jgi:hypothetical protein
VRPTRVLGGTEQATDHARHEVVLAKTRCRFLGLFYKIWICLVRPTCILGSTEQATGHAQQEHDLVQDSLCQIEVCADNGRRCVRAGRARGRDERRPGRPERGRQVDIRRPRAYELSPVFVDRSSR